VVERISAYSKFLQAATLYGQEDLMADTLQSSLKSLKELGETGSIQDHQEALKSYLTLFLKACFCLSDKDKEQTSNCISKTAAFDCLLITLEVLEYFDKMNESSLITKVHEEKALKICVNCDASYEQVNFVLNLF